MAQTSNTFRIFVSSTFSDLHAERNALQSQVFPRLRELCLQNGCRFQAIDLRWGVSAEAGRDQKTMKICRQGNRALSESYAASEFYRSARRQIRLAASARRNFGG